MLDSHSIRAAATLTLLTRTQLLGTRLFTPLKQSGFRNFSIKFQSHFKSEAFNEKINAFGVKSTNAF